MFNRWGLKGGGPTLRLHHGQSQGGGELSPRLMYMPASPLKTCYSLSCTHFLNNCMPPCCCCLQISRINNAPHPRQKNNEQPTVVCNSLICWGIIYFIKGDKWSEGLKILTGLACWTQQPIVSGRLSHSCTRQGEAPPPPQLQKTFEIRSNGGGNQEKSGRFSREYVKIRLFYYNPP